MGAKITQKSFATANDAMALPVDNSGFDNHTTVESIVLDYGRDVENMIQGDGQGSVYVDNGLGQGTVLHPTWLNIDELTITAGAIAFDPSKSNNFSLTLTENATLSVPATLNIRQTGLLWRIYVTQDGTGGRTLNFSALSNRYQILPDSQGLNMAAGGRSIVEIYCFSGAPLLAVRIIRLFGEGGDLGGVVQPKTSGLIPFEVTIPSAEVLTGNTTPITFIPALGANLVAVLVELYEVAEYGGVGYATNVGVNIKYSGGTQISYTDIQFTANIRRQWQLGNAAVLGFTTLIENEAIIWQVDTGNPTAGNSDITYYGYYRIIDLS